MSLLTTAAASVHQVSAAAALAAPPLRSLDQEAVGNNGDRVIKSVRSRYGIVANMLLSGGWLIEQHTLRTHRDLDPETNRRVAIKDVCVAGAAATTAAEVIAGFVFEHYLPEGVRITAAGTAVPDTPAPARVLWHCIKAIKLANRAFVAGAIGFTPLVNFQILASYRPGLLYRLFT